MPEEEPEAEEESGDDTAEATVPTDGSVGDTPAGFTPTYTDLSIAQLDDGSLQLDWKEGEVAYRQLVDTVRCQGEVTESVKQSNGAHARGRGGGGWRQSERKRKREGRERKLRERGGIERAKGRET